MIRMLSRASSVFCQSKSFCKSEHKSHMPGEGLSKSASTNMRKSENKCQSTSQNQSKSSCKSGRANHGKCKHMNKQQ